ncbi:MAG: aminotransferase class IV [Myxococcales bacterium]|nr:aminotransferase class IV [Myxococcales bacterium]
MPFEEWRHFFTEGVHLVTPSIRHIPPQCIDPKMKNRSRLHWWIADQQSHAVDPRATSLLLDLEGNITECSGSNVVIIKGRTIYSPTSRNILEGVSLVTVRELAPGLGLDWVEKELQPYDVVNADEAWLKHWILNGLAALEALVAGHSETGAFCHGDTPTLADICLVPQLYNARRGRLDLAPYPNLVRIDENCLGLDAFARAAPEQQAHAR